MYNDKRILAIIPARKGSKGIKNKNIVDLNGKPLIYYTIREALKSDYVDKVVVSTDGEKIAKISKEIGAQVPYIRPEHLSTDEAKSIDVVLHCIEYYEEKLKEKYDYVLLLQPTSPLRKVEHIDEAIRKLMASSEKSLIGLCESDKNPVIMRTIEKNKMKEVISFKGDNLRRQALPKFYTINGAIYINAVSMLKEKKAFLDDKTLPYIMDKKSSVDIDDYVDLELAKIMMNMTNV